MSIDRSLRRIRAYLASPGVNIHRVAQAAGVRWHSVNAIKTGGNPTLATLLAVEAVMLAERPVVPRRYRRRQADQHPAATQVVAP